MGFNLINPILCITTYICINSPLFDNITIKRTWWIAFEIDFISILLTEAVQAQINSASGDAL